MRNEVGALYNFGSDLKKGGRVPKNARRPSGKSRRRSMLTRNKVRSDKGDPKENSNLGVAQTPSAGCFWNEVGALYNFGSDLKKGGRVTKSPQNARRMLGDRDEDADEDGGQSADLGTRRPSRVRRP